jgi:hypothetical protein
MPDGTTTALGAPVGLWARTGGKEYGTVIPVIWCLCGTIRNAAALFARVS